MNLLSGHARVHTRKRDTKYQLPIQGSPEFDINLIKHQKILQHLEFQVNLHLKYKKTASKKKFIQQTQLHFHYVKVLHSVLLQKTRRTF